ncbi:4581_t:CDS:2 [Funneliformis mosseae]|uniref:4581_t:CDS:1 n=1 Tax=Funneliformis mosseae TaxID=27381 RepID=A0A9N9GMC8_FUNMO|nr:4581_t:CDS:2 [Funneliformis mosseae]
MRELASLSSQLNILRPTIADVVTDVQLLKAAEILREKSFASAYSLASVLNVIKYVLGKPYFTESVFGNKKSLAFDFRGQACVVEFASGEKNKRSFSSPSLETRNPSSPSQLLQPTIADILTDSQTLRLIEVLKQKSKESPLKLASLLCIIKAVLDDVGLKGLLFSNKITFTHLVSNNSNNTRDYIVEFEDQLRYDNFFPPTQHNEDMMDELEKDEIVEEPPPEPEVWRHVPTVTKRKRNSDSPSDEDHCAPQNTSSKRRSTDKHKAPPLSCEAVKRLFTGISKTTLLQRLEESKLLISSIKESYSGIRPPNTSLNLSSSSRLNLLCHLLQSPPTSRIDGISSKVFSNLELYKLFTTYNAYKEEVAQNIHSDQMNSPSKRNHSTSPTSTEPSPITFPTYSSFIDPTVTLHIKEQTGGKEVGKHRLNCAWRLSILCELLGKGVLLMTKELSGAKLERILVEEFSKLVDFLKNPDNQDWVSSVREKMELSGFEEVYEPLDEADIGGGIVARSLIGNDLMKQGVEISNGSHHHNGSGHVEIPQVIFALDQNISHQISSQQQDKRITTNTEDTVMNHLHNNPFGQRYSESVSVTGDPSSKDDSIAVPIQSPSQNSRPMAYLKRNELQKF